jgi:DNA-binding transcriptional MerR regulator
VDETRTTSPGLRIGEVARRAGVTTATLRAWEARYGLLPSARTAGGQRLYREADVGRVQAVRRLVDRGWSVAGAVSQVLDQPGRPAEAGGGAGGEPPGDGSGQEGRGADVASGVHLRGGSRRPVLDALDALDALAGIDAYAVLAAYETSRDLLRATDAGQVRDILAGLVRRLGGEVGEAVPHDDTVLPVDLAFGEGPPLLPRAPSPSVARMRLEAVLPLVVEDARIVVHRLQLTAPPRAPTHAGAKMPAR